MAANAHKGELSIEVDGKALVLRYTANSICALEEKTGKSFIDFSANLTSLSALRQVLWAGLILGQPSTTLEDAGDVLQAIGATQAVSAITEALQRAFPPVDKTARPH